MKFKSNEEGKCPICNSENLEYFGMELEDTAVYFPWHCPDCDTDGKEWYYVNFSEVLAYTPDGDMSGYEEGKCPECGGEIDYGTTTLDGNSLGYEYSCSNCDGSGTEWYDLDFDSHTIDGHEGESIEVITESRSATDIEKEIQTKLAQYMRLQKANNGDTAKSKDIEDEIEDLEAQLKKLKKEAIDYKNDKYTATTAEDGYADREFYGKNMTKRNKLRSYNQAHRNLVRMDVDSRVSDGQAVDQISFENLPNDDLEAYKYNKHQAKSAEYWGDTTWADEHNKIAKQYADKIRAKHKKEETKDIWYSVELYGPSGNDRYDVTDTYKEAIASKKKGEKEYPNCRFEIVKMNGSIPTQKTNKKQEAIDNDEEEPNIDFDDTISLLDIALKEIPTVGVEDWGKDDELLFTADTKVMFENLKNYEEEIPKYYYDNASNDDWSNGIDDYLEEIKGVNLNNGDSDNTYNWNAPLTHDVEFTIYEADDGCYFKGSIHRTGDVRGNYTTEFLLKFDDKDDCLETLFDVCSENCYRKVTVDGVDYTVSPHFFNEYVDIWNNKTQESYDDVYCDCIDKLKEIIAGNTDDEPTQY